MRVVLTGLSRAAITVAALAALLGPVAGFLGHAGVPLALRAAWVVIAVLGAVAPVPSFLALLVGGPLLPVVPSLAGWPDVSLIEQWALALLIPAAIRAVWAAPRAAPAPSRWAPVLAVMATASAIAAIAPLTVAHGGPVVLAREIVTFFRTDYVVSNSQRQVLASLMSWAIVIEGLAVFWLARRVVAVTGRVPVAVAMAASAVIVAVLGIWQWWTGAHLLAFWREFDPFLGASTPRSPTSTRWEPSSPCSSRRPCGSR